MPPTAKDKIINFLKENLQNLEADGGTGAHLKFPNFDLMPFDYLEFAEDELNKNTPVSKINCVSHLKRAVECEMDTFTSVLNVEKALNFPKKLEFIGACGIVSARSLTRMNAIRNKVEHEYAIPDINELEIYFDLASSFVQAVEGAIYMLGMYADMSWQSDDGSTRLSMRIDTTNMHVEFGTFCAGTKEIINFGNSDLTEYAEGVRAYLLLLRADMLVSPDYVLAKLEGKKLVATGR